VKSHRGPSDKYKLLFILKVYTLENHKFSLINILMDSKYIEICHVKLIVTEICVCVCSCVVVFRLCWVELI
jgi:hypothetical protein